MQRNVSFDTKKEPGWSSRALVFTERLLGRGVAPTRLQTKSRPQCSAILCDRLASQARPPVATA